MRVPGNFQTALGKLAHMGRKSRILIYLWRKRKSTINKKFCPQERLGLLFWYRLKITRTKETFASSIMSPLFCWCYNWTTLDPQRKSEPQTKESRRQQKRSQVTTLDVISCSITWGYVRCSRPNERSMNPANNGAHFIVKYFVIFQPICIRLIRRAVWFLSHLDFFRGFHGEIPTHKAGHAPTFKNPSKSVTIYIINWANKRERRKTKMSNTCRLSVEITLGSWKTSPEKPVPISTPRSLWKKYPSR